MQNHKENKWDQLLRIKTSGRDDTRSDQYRYPYEPTPYCVLERLANTGYIRKQHTLVDYGCGKGRVDFFLSSQTRCKTIGIEYDERMYEVAVQNQKTVAAAERTTFLLEHAEQYCVPEDVERFYFFNPFSVELLQSVMGRILESYYGNPRQMLLFFYYPSAEYISYLMTVEEAAFLDEIDCRDLFDGEDERERIVVFEIG